MHQVPALELNQTIAKCDICHLKAKKGLGVGNPEARILLVAQNPGTTTERNPDLVPFDYHLWWSTRGEKEWRSGAVLTKMLLDVGINLNDLYITNAMKCQGKVESTYILNCSDWLEGELLHLKRLRLIVAMGGPAGVRLGIRRPGSLDMYRSLLKPDLSWVLGMVAHPAAPLYSGGISMNEYRHQWEFIAAVVRRL
jgi:uracil-DNA glycosylase family 4